MDAARNRNARRRHHRQRDNAADAGAFAQWQLDASRQAWRDRFDAVLACFTLLNLFNALESVLDNVVVFGLAICSILKILRRPFIYMSFTILFVALMLHASAAIASYLCSHSTTRIASSWLPTGGVPDICLQIELNQRSEGFAQSQLHHKLDTINQTLGPTSNISTAIKLADLYGVELWGELNFLDHLTRNSMPFATEVHEKAHELVETADAIHKHLGDFRIMENAFHVSFDASISIYADQAGTILHDEKQSSALSSYVINVIYDFFPAVFASSKLGLFIARYIDFFEHSGSECKKIASTASAVAKTLYRLQTQLYELSDLLRAEQKAWEARCIIPYTPGWVYDTPQQIRDLPACGPEPAHLLDRLTALYDFLYFLLSVNAQAQYNFKQQANGLNAIRAQLQSSHQTAQIAIYGRLPSSSSSFSSSSSSSPPSPATLDHTISSHDLDTLSPRLPSPLSARRILNSVLPALQGLHNSLGQLRKDTRANIKTDKDREAALRKEAGSWVREREGGLMGKRWKGAGRASS